MQASVESIRALQALAGDYKFWSTVALIIIAGYKAYDWVKQIRTKDIPDLHAEVKRLGTSMDALGSKVDAQTQSLVSELKEMRSDFRTFYIAPPAMMMPVARQRKPSVPRKPKVTVAINQ